MIFVGGLLMAISGIGLVALDRLVPGVGLVAAGLAAMLYGGQRKMG